MVARILRLRVALLAAPFTGGARNAVRAIIARLLLLVLAASLAAAPILFAQNDAQVLGRYDVAFGSLILLAAFLIPLFVPSATIDRRALQQYPATPARVALALLVTAPVTWIGLAALVWVGTFVALRVDMLEWNALSILSLVVALVSIPVYGVFGGALGDLAANSQRLSLLRKGLGVATLISVLPLVLMLTVALVRGEGAKQLADTAQSFSWTPFGAAFAVLHTGAEGIDSIVLQLGIHVAMLALAVGGTISLTTGLMTRVERPAHGASMSSSLGWFEYFSQGPAMSIGARSLTYWMRDPRYLVSLVAIPVIPVLVVGVLLFAGVDGAHLALIPLPLVLIMVGWMVHNDIATDSTALWIHVASGVKGSQDRLGRLIPVFVLGVPVLILGASISVLVLGNWEATPAVIALGFVALCTSAALSSVVSVLSPYPTSRPGESPFVQPAWQGAGAGFAQTLAFLGSAVLTAPVFFVIFANPEIGFGQSLMVLVGSLVYGGLVLAAGIALGGLVYNRRSSELLAFTQMFD